MKNGGLRDPDVLIRWLKKANGKVLFEFRAQNKIGISAIHELLNDESFTKKIDNLFPNDDPCCPRCGGKPKRIITTDHAPESFDRLSPPLLYDVLAGRLEYEFSCHPGPGNLKCSGCGYRWSTDWVKKAWQSKVDGIIRHSAMRSWQNLPAMAGIYEIITPNGRYVGQSKDIRKRIGEHLTDLQQGIHSNYRLQNSFDQLAKGRTHGNPRGVAKDDFGVEVRELAPVTLVGERLTTWLFRREAYWITHYRRENTETLNIEKPTLPPFDFATFRTEKSAVREALARLPSEIERLETALPGKKEQIAKELLALKQDEREVLNKIHKRLYIKWMIVATIAAAGVAVNATQDNNGIAMISLLIALYVLIVPWRGSVDDRYTSIVFEISDKRKILERIEKEILTKKKQLRNARYEMKRLEEEEGIFFAE